MSQERVEAAREVSHGRVLLVDDDESSASLLGKYLEHQGHTVDQLDDPKELANALQSPFDAIVLDVRTGSKRAFQLLDVIRDERPGVSVVMLTAEPEVETVVEAMRRGAYDYVTKPIDMQRLAVSVRNACEKTRLQMESAGLKAAIMRHDGGPDLICASQAMSDVISLVERVADSFVPVLIHGESGAGKEVVARRIHARSRLRDRPFVVVNCTALPAEKMEEELFGKGPSTTLRKGTFGTLFLDEVGELSMDVQTRLLRLLQERAIEARIVAATSLHLPSEVSRGTFRADLFYRLNVFSITVPPLRDRQNDIPALARYTLSRWSKTNARAPIQISDDATVALKQYGWPGNVRELNNVLERAALICQDGTISVDDLPEEVRDVDAVHDTKATTDVAAHTSSAALRDANVRPLKDLEREMMVVALQETRGNVSEAARRLGIGRATFYRRAQRHRLTREDGFPG